VAARRERQLGNNFSGLNCPTGENYRIDIVGEFSPTSNLLKGESVFKSDAFEVGESRKCSVQYESPNLVFACRSNLLPGRIAVGLDWRSPADQTGRLRSTDMLAGKRCGREYLRKTPVFDLATRYSGEIAETPFVQRVLRPASRPYPIVGKESPRLSRHERRKERERHMRFRESVKFSYAMDWPLNIGLTITWAALMTAGEHNEGHCLGRGEWDREKYMRNELARLCRSEGLPFVALWGRDIGADMGSHVHLSMFWPSYKLDQLVAVIERITGSSAAFVLKPYTADVVARSVCGGWQINMNTRDKEGATDWVDYIAAQHSKHPASPEIKSKAFGISQAIGKAAQVRERPALEARAAKYSFTAPETAESL
jgi:hypothetical protein